MLRPPVHWVRVVYNYCIYSKHIQLMRVFVQQTSPSVLLDSYLLLVGDARCSVSVRLGAIEMLFAFAQSPDSENSSAEAVCERLRDAVARAFADPVLGFPLVSAELRTQPLQMQRYLRFLEDVSDLYNILITY